MLNLGVEFPNFTCKTTLGELNLHEYLGTSWGLICSHPADFTPVCTTEIARMAQLTKETESRDVKVVFLSCDPVESHHQWIKDIEQYSGCKVPFPIIDDEDNKISKMTGMYEEGLDKFQTVRGVFVLDPTKKIKASICYPDAAGRNFDEVIRLIDEFQSKEKNNEVSMEQDCDDVSAPTTELPPEPIQQNNNSNQDQISLTAQQSTINEEMDNEDEGGDNDGVDETNNKDKRHEIKIEKEDELEAKCPEIQPPSSQFPTNASTVEPLPADKTADNNECETTTAAPIEHQENNVSSQQQQPALPTRQYLDATVVPILHSALSQLARVRPKEPIKFLAQYLMEHGDIVQ